MFNVFDIVIRLNWEIYFSIGFTGFTDIIVIFQLSSKERHLSKGGAYS